MIAIRNIEDLEKAIIELEAIHAQEEALLIEQYKLSKEKLKPVQLIKNTFQELFSARDFRKDLTNTSIGLVTGYFSRKFAIGASSKPLVKFFGGILQMGITSMVTQNGDEIRAKLHSLISRFTNRKTKPEPPQNNLHGA